MVPFRAYQNESCFIALGRYCCQGSLGRQRPRYTLKSQQLEHALDRSAVNLNASAGNVAGPLRAEKSNYRGEFFGLP